MFQPVIEKLMEDSPPEPGKLITECYDLQRHKPSPENQELISRVRVSPEHRARAWRWGLWDRFTQ